MRKEMEKGIRGMEYETTYYETIEEINKLINDNEQFHDAEIVWVEHKGDNRASVTVKNTESYCFVFSDVSEFFIAMDPVARWLIEIIVKNTEHGIQVIFEGTNIEITAKNFIVQTTKRVK